MEYKFQMGDRVVLVKHFPSCLLSVGTTGTICELPRRGGHGYGVESDKPSGGHSCSGRCKYGYGWYIQDNCLELLIPEEADGPIDLDNLL